MTAAAVTRCPVPPAMLCATTLLLASGVLVLLTLRPAARRGRPPALDGVYEVTHCRRHRGRAAVAAFIRRGRLELVAADGAVEAFALGVGRGAALDARPLGPPPGRRLPGVYRLAGGVLAIAFAETGGRPTDPADERDGVSRLVLVRR